jgi:stress response protein SCP2
VTVELQKGGNAPVDGAQVAVRVDWAGPAGVEADISAYLLGEDGRVGGDHDMIFYNQPSGGGGAVALSAAAGASTFAVDLARLPAAVDRITFCLTVDGGHRFASLARADLSVSGGATAIRFPVPRDGASEAAMILGELYRRQGVWKFRAVGQGFDGGLAPLARSFGIQVDDEPVAAPAPAPAPAAAPTAPPPQAGPVSLEKKVAAKAPHLVNLAKTASVTLEKKRLSNVRAQVVLVLDRSGSMNHQYRRGDVQRVVEKIIPLAVHFDDDGALDCWAFANAFQNLPPVTLDNVNGYVDQAAGGWQRWPGGGNDEPAVMRAVIDRYRAAQVPVYIIFISDGGVGKNREIKALIMEAANYPIFWQFVGIGGANYGVLQKLDEMRGRRVDNANFFSLDDINRISDDQLYDRLLNEFPAWLHAAWQAGIIR